MNVYETKRYEPDFNYESGLPGMFETSKGGYVAHSDYATLFSELESVKAERDAQQKRADALAVENAAIKAMNDCLSEELRGYESDGAFEGPHMHLLWWKTETPATDAALAAIEARGVEKFAKVLRVKGDDAFFDAIAEAQANAADAFAKQMREAK